MTGFFITFEGGDGSGKSTQVDLLCNRLMSSGHSVTRTFEPGGTSLGLALRELLLNTRVPISSMTELLLFEAARAENVEKVIKPALRRNSVVVCDRFIDSSLAYQGFGKGLSLRKIRTVNRLAAQGVKPDLTVLMDIDPEISLQRRAEGEGDRIGGHLQLGFDLGDPLAGHRREGGWELAVHQKIRAGYLEIASAEPGRWLIVDAQLKPEIIASLIWERVRTIVDAGSTAGVPLTSAGGYL